MKKNNKVKRIINLFFYNFFIFLIKFYQKIISPALPARCRYYPTCSEYGRQALKWHGTWRGSRLLLNRVSRCHPWGGHGVDFVPLPLYRYNYQYVSKASIFADHNHAQGYACVYRDTTSYVSRLNMMLG